MKQMMLAAAVVVALPGLAWAQRSTQMVAPNQNNTQDQANGQRAPLNEQEQRSSGQATSIPTPTLHQGMTSDVQKPQISR